MAVLLLAGCGDDDAPSTGAEATTSTRVDPVDSDEMTDTTDIDVTTTTAADAADPGSQDGAPPVDADAVIEVTVSGGAVEGGGRHQVALGDSVALVITSDVADEVHLHGYDLSTELVAGEPTVLTFDADIPGVFAAELHDSELQLVELEIS